MNIFKKLHLIYFFYVEVILLLNSSKTQDESGFTELESNLHYSINEVIDEKSDNISEQSISKRSIHVNLIENWSFPIIYAIDKQLNNKTIISVLKYISEHTCVKFKNSQNNNLEDAQIRYELRNSCASMVGKPSKKNFSDIWLTQKCSEHFGLTLHETFHSLGLYHEHQRYDRDKYIKVFENKLPESSKYNILMKIYENTSTNLNFSYDYGSLMHYAPTLRIGGEVVMKVNNIDPYNKMIGQKVMATFSDFRAINLYYCSGDCLFHELKCKNGGYRDWKSCIRCICPSGYKGNKCNHFDPKSRSYTCNQGEIEATNDIKTILEKGKKICNYRIKAKGNGRLCIHIDNVKTIEKNICTQRQGLEVRYLEDKGITGLCLCGSYENIYIMAPSKEVYIEYYGSENDHFFKLSYHMNRNSSLTNPTILYNSTSFDIK